MNIEIKQQGNAPVMIAIAKRGGNQNKLAQELGLDLESLSAEKDLTISNNRNQLVMLFWVQKKAPIGHLRRKITHYKKNIATLKSHCDLWMGPGTQRHFRESVQALLMCTYKIGFYKQKNTSTTESVLTIIDKSSKDLKNEIAEIQELWKSQSAIMNLVNYPSNKKKPEDLAKFAKASAKKHGYSARVMTKAQIKKTGLGALLAVNRGSEWPPAFIIMEYKGKAQRGKKLQKIGLVGKGVTFDTGGLSIKGSTNMHYMKSDMGGAAAVLGTMDAAARLKLSVHLIGIVPATDNCVDALAIKPGDVIESYSGKSIEIIDTDAEGRLILADGLWYMQKHFQPDVMIDLATLTGSVVRTLGYEAAGLFSKNDKLCKALTKAGNDCGERCWRLPLWDVYGPEMDSDIADVKNFHGKSTAGAITAAKFLERFTNDHPAWAHLDIAGVAFGNSGVSDDKSATGFGVQLLINFMRQNFA